MAQFEYVKPEKVSLKDDPELNEQWVQGRIDYYKIGLFARIEIPRKMICSKSFCCTKRNGIKRLRR